MWPILPPLRRLAAIVAILVILVLVWFFVIRGGSEVPGVDGGGRDVNVYLGGSSEQETARRGVSLMRVSALPTAGLL